MYPLPRLLVEGALYVFVGVLATRLLLVPLHRPRPSRRLTIAAVLGFGLPIVVAALGPAYAQSEAPADVSHSLLHQAWLCLRYGMFLSVPVVLLFAALDRQLARGRLFFTLSASIGGVAGNLALLLNCPDEQTAHQLLGHATVGLVLLIGMIAIATFARRGARKDF